MKLSREIRDLIWTEVLGGHKLNIHIGQKGPYSRYLISHTLCILDSREVPRMSSASLIKELEDSGQLVTANDGFIDNESVDKAVEAENMCQSCCLVPRYPDYIGGFKDEKIDCIPFLSTCSQIRDEAEPILYGNAIFCFNGLGVLHNFLYSRTLGQLQQIREVSLFLEDNIYRSGLPVDRVWEHQIPSSTMLKMERLKALKLGINRKYIGDPGSCYWESIPRYVSFALQSFRLCPLEHVEVSIGLSPVPTLGAIFDGVHTGHQKRVAAFPREQRDGFTEELKKMLLDTDGKAKQLEAARGECYGPMEMHPHCVIQ
jgi:hypothetical protein